MCVLRLKAEGFLPSLNTKRFPAPPAGADATLHCNPAARTGPVPNHSTGPRLGHYTGHGKKQTFILGSYKRSQ